MPREKTISPPDTVGPFMGVFSENVTHALGFGSTKRRQSAKTFWLIERTPQDQLFIQALNEHMVPVGEKKSLPKDRFLADYCPEPDLFMGVVRPRMQELEEAIRRGDRHRSQEELFSAEVEYKLALQIDEEDIRANFGLGLTFLARGDAEKGRYVFGKLVSLEAAFRPEHKHLFNEFGIALRKSRMFKESALYYTRALDLAQDDDHLLYNLARAHFELLDFNESHACVQKALNLNPRLAEAEQLLRVLIREDPSLLTAGFGLCEQDVAPGQA
jgi:tetratricopeptide (TPR) repeat protein